MRHMALAWSRQHGTQPKYPSFQQASLLLAPALPWGRIASKVAFLAEPSMRGKRALISM